ncbi:MAG: hypothetical protein GX643_12980 [Acidimicrobiales bacterium]|nr:hypothetical protein [Acidimicrobiales bacterium]
MSDRCDSCGDSGTDMKTVQRIYLKVDPLTHQVVDEQLADEFETWCPICRVTYAHQLI